MDRPRAGALGVTTAAALAFDAIADRFDERFGAWRSVAAQRRAVYSALLRAFPVGSRLLEIGGGTGIDAAWLTERGRQVFLTDASPAMVRVARQRVGRAEVVAAEGLDGLDEGPFDGVFSNFAALNCVGDLVPVANGLARLVRPGGQALLVFFGTFAPSEFIVQLVRRDVRAAVRRLHHDAPARLGGHDFVVRYHRPWEITSAMRPWFRLVRRQGIGVTVPPSAAEPWISTHPRLLAAMEATDRVIGGPLAGLGDHVLYHFERA
jgi:SAM-dependent methyltransferase